MAGRATWMLVMLAALPLAIAAARAQTSEYDALPEPAAPAAVAPALPQHGKVLPEAKQKSAIAAGKEKAAPATAALGKAEPKQKEDELPPARHMAPSAAIPPFPGDEKGPKTIEFLGFCAGQYDRCMQTVRDVGEKIPDAELCVPPELDFTTVTDRVRKWATLRPDVQNLPSGRVIAAALRAIYPCKHGAPARAAEKNAPKAAKSAQ